MPKSVSLSKVTSPDEIDWTQLEYLANGSWGTVFVKDTTNTRNRYAVKVGRIHALEVEGLRQAHAAGLGVPVYAFLEGVRTDSLPESVRSHLPYQSRDDWTVSILILGRAKPLREYYSRQWERWDNIVDALARRAYSAGLDWPDDHSGNVGRYRGKWVILDGINYSNDLLSSGNSNSYTSW
jgi:hypothetical protein